MSPDRAEAARRLAAGVPSKPEPRQGPMASDEAVRALVEVAPRWQPLAPPAPARRRGWEAIQGVSEFLTATESEADFLEPRLLARGSLTLLNSPRGLGKTHVAHALAVKHARAGLRGLLIDRDNSRRELKRRLRCWGADGVASLKVLGRDDAPPLTDERAWREFPFPDYDLVIIDSLDSSTEGVGEQDSAKPSRALASLLDLAHTANGPAVLVLGNTVKSGSHGRGSGIIEDRADIVFEVRDATDLRPTGAKEWWRELPPADRGSWVDRAARRKRRDAYRLAFVSSKFRIGEEPDPFVLEVRFSPEPWTCEDVTEDLAAAGEESRVQAAREKAGRIEHAAATLAARVATQAASGTPMHKRDAEPFLMALGLSRNEARALIAERAGGVWQLSGDARRGNPLVLLPAGGENSGGFAAGLRRPGDPHQPRTGAAAILAAQEPCGRPVSSEAETAPEALGIDAAFWPLTLRGHGGQQPSGVSPTHASAEVTCPDCGGRVLSWSGVPVCSSCHRRRQVPEPGQEAADV